MNDYFVCMGTFIFIIVYENATKQFKSNYSDSSATSLLDARLSAGLHKPQTSPRRTPAAKYPTDIKNEK